MNTKPKLQPVNPLIEHVRTASIADLLTVREAVDAELDRRNDELQAEITRLRKGRS